jgi:hypothetical protein
VNDGESARLAALVRRSPALDPIARRQWLAVLPYLSERDRTRLAAILESDGGTAPA